jgi:hypothetical protein
MPNRFSVNDEFFERSSRRFSVCVSKIAMLFFVSPFLICSWDIVSKLDAACRVERHYGARQFPLAESVATSGRSESEVSSRPENHAC